MKFPFTDLPWWVACLALLTGWSIMEAAKYYGIRVEMMILFVIALYFLLRSSSKKR